MLLLHDMQNSGNYYHPDANQWQNAADNCLDNAADPIRPPHGCFGPQAPI